MRLLKTIKFNPYIDIDFFTTQSGKTIKVRITSSIHLPRERFLSQCFPTSEYDPESILETQDFIKVIKRYE